MDLDSSENIKAHRADRFRKQRRATKIGNVKISKRLDKELNHTKEQNQEARKAVVKYDVREGLAEKHQGLTLEEQIQQELQRDFELYGPYEIPSDDSSSYSSYSSSFEEGSEEELSDSNDYYSQELSGSASDTDSYHDFLDNQSEYSAESSLDKSSDSLDDIQEAIAKLSNITVSDAEEEKDIRKSKSHKNHLSHQKDKHDNTEKKILTFAFAGLHKRGGHHSRILYNIGRSEKRTLAAYQEELNPTEIAAQPKERAQDIRKYKK